MNVKDTLLDELIKNHEMQNKLAHEDLSGWDPRTINSKITSKRIAADEAKKLESEYKKQVTSRSGVVFVYNGTSESLKAFRKFCKELNLTHYDTSSLYTRLAKPVEANLGNRREFNSHSILMLVSEMAVVGKELGVEYINAPKLKGIAICKDFNETVNEVRKCIRNSETGDNLAKMYFETTVLNDSLNNGFNKPSLALVVFCSSKEEAEALSKDFLNNNSALVDLNEVDLTNGYIFDLTQKLKKTVKLNGEKNGK
jgi:hypothetical protein